MRAQTFLVGFLVVATYLMAGCSGSGGTTVPPKAVDMKNTEFQPGNVTIAKGTTVIWTNRDGFSHTVTSDDDAGPLKSANVQPGLKYEYKFNTPGTYKYHCKPHSNKPTGGEYAGMTGTIIVTA